MGQLGGNVQFFTNAVFLKDLTDGSLTAGIYVGRIIIVDTAMKRLQQLLLCQSHIDPALLALKTHAAKSQHR